MRRRAKPAKAKVEAKLPAARKSRNNQGSKVRDLEKRLRRETARRERAERALLETLDRQRATGEILQVISRSSANAQPVFDAIVNAAARLLRTDGGILTRIVGDLIELAAFTSSGPSGDEVLKAGFPVSVHDSGSMQAITVRDQAPFVSADFVTDGRLNEGTRSRLRARGFRSGVAVPLLQQGIPIGAISITRRDPGAFTPDEIALLQTFADQAVIAIENVRLFTELQEKNRALTHAHAQVTEALEQQTATAEVLKVISRSTFDLQPVLDTLIENAARLCASQRGVIMRRDGDSYHGVAFYNVSPELTDFIKRHPITPGRHSVTARVALERRTIHVADLQADPEYRYALRDADPIRTELGVPIFRGDDIVGVIILHKLEVQPFTDKQIELVETFADQAVIAIENVRLFKELQERNRDLTEALEQQTATSEILRVISSSPTDVQPVFDTIVRSTVKLCDGLFSALYRFDGELIHHVAQHNYTPEALEAVHRVFPARPTRALGTGRAILERAVVHIPDVEGDPEYLNQALTRAIGFRSGLFVPMRREGAPIGVIVVARADPGPFSDSEIALLQTFADQAVIAIENVRLFTELQEKNRDLTGSVRSANRDERDPAGHRKLAYRRAAGLRHDRSKRRQRVRRPGLRGVRRGRGYAPSGRNARSPARTSGAVQRGVPETARCCRRRRRANHPRAQCFSSRGYRAQPERDRQGHRERAAGGVQDPPDGSDGPRHDCPWSDRRHKRSPDTVLGSTGRTAQNVCRSGCDRH